MLGVVTDFASLALHRMLVADTVRCDAYRRAIAAVVRPGDEVLDVGTGSGLLALFACQAGASRVVAVERTGIVAMARKIIARSEHASRIEIVHGDARELELPRRVAVVLSELVSKAVFGQRHHETIALCRERFLAPGGRMVPEHVALVAAPFDAEAVFAGTCFPPPDRYGIDFTAAERALRDEPFSAALPAGGALSKPQTVHAVDSLTVTGPVRLDVTARFAVERAGTLHGLGLWFDARLAPGVELSNRPPGLGSWDQLFLPLRQATPVEPGFAVELRLGCAHPEATEPIWSWSTRVLDEAGATRVELAQSSLASAVPVPP